MSDPDWTPFGMTPQEQVDWSVLHDGITDWMRTPITEWITVALTRDPAHTSADRGLLTGIEAMCPGGSLRGPGEDVYALAVAQEITDWLPNMALRAVDYLLHARAGSQAALQQLLDQGHSKWTIGERIPGSLGLVERVPAGVQDAAETIMSSAGEAGRLLREAWAFVHRLEPSPSDAYARAVKAVEIAAIPKVVPRQVGATLGHVIGQLDATKDWRLPTREDPQSPTWHVVVGMLRALFYGHRDRHGKVDYSDVTLPEARAAVDLAVVLVDLFSADLVQRR